MKKIAIGTQVILFLLCCLLPVHAASLTSIYSLLLSAKEQRENDYRYVEICQVGENGSDISSGLVEWNMVLNQQDGGDIYWIALDNEYKSYQFLNNDLNALPNDFAYKSLAPDASWQTYDISTVRMLMSDEYTNIVEPQLSYERQDDTSKTLLTNEVINFYHKEIWTREEALKILNNHIRNVSCVRDEPQEIVGCEYMWHVDLSYTIDGSYFVGDEEKFYHYTGTVPFENVVLAYDTFSEGNANKHQCWYPNEEGNTSKGYVTYDNQINNPSSKTFTETCSGNGCAGNSRVLERTAGINLDIDTAMMRVQGIEKLIDLDEQILLKHAFTLNLQEDSPNGDHTSLTAVFTPKPRHFSRPVKYCSYYDYEGECNADNPDVVRVREDLL